MASRNIPPSGAGTLHHGNGAPRQIVNRRQIRLVAELAGLQNANMLRNDSLRSIGMNAPYDLPGISFQLAFGCVLGKFEIHPQQACDGLVHHARGQRLHFSVPMAAEPGWRQIQQVRAAISDHHTCRVRSAALRAQRQLPNQSILYFLSHLHFECNNVFNSFKAHSLVEATAFVHTGDMAQRHCRMPLRCQGIAKGDTNADHAESRRLGRARGFRDQGAAQHRRRPAGPVDSGASCRHVQPPGYAIAYCRRIGTPRTTSISLAPNAA